MLRKILVIAILILLLLRIPQNVYADNDFKVSIASIYEVTESGKSSVTNEIVIENLKTEKYPAEYTLTLKNINPVNIKVFEEGSEVGFKDERDNDLLKITVNFAKKSLGLGSKKNLKVKYEIDELAKRTGEVWELSIPRISDENSYQDYKLTLKAPKTFGSEAYISPAPIDFIEDDNFFIYTFNKANLLDASVVAGFGKFQVFSFVLDYHLQNTSNSQQVYKIAIPPDTSYQRMYYENITPAPINVDFDEDGNWLASYRLGGKKQLDIKVEGNVQLFANPRKYLTPEPVNLLNNIMPKKYWESDDAGIKKIASELKTPEEIYNFVVRTLKYNEEKNRKTSIRLGAREALSQPLNANCLEFTDLFIAIARAAGIPAREVNGFAYTENPKIQPLSLVNDILHAWPEYWNDNTHAWTPVDPTWESTSGVSYFTKFDLRHFTFVIHGKNPEDPVAPGSYKVGENYQKDVFVSFGTLPKNIIKKLDAATNMSNDFILSRKLKTTLENRGMEGLYDTRVKIYFDENLKKDFYVKMLPPYSIREEVTKIPLTLLSVKSPKVVRTVVSETIVEAQGSFLIDILTQALLMFILFTTSVLLIFFKIRKRKS